MQPAEPQPKRMNITSAGTLDERQRAAELRAEDLRIDARLLAVEMRRLYPVRPPVR